AAVVTWGNLVIASQRDNFSIEDLNGNKLTLFGADTINASVALYALKQFGIEPELADPLAGAAETKALLETDPEAIVLTAEPMFTAAKAANDKITGFPVNDLLDNGYTQAGLFVRAETLEKNPELVKAALAEIEESCGLCMSDPDKVVEALSALEMKFPKAAIPGCAISYVDAAQAKRLVEATVEIDPAQFGGEEPADEFYFENAEE
ncbi:MAG: ABC transporter substrate-binding protein, partial [Clostridia bacterium]|nr:ABC transporter substrate-binding protein [Clostridia bacterium]